METAARFEPNVEVVRDPESLAQRSVDFFVTRAKKAIEAKSAFHVALSGGHTPKRFFELLGQTPRAKSLPWDRVHLFWVDERYVPPSSHMSNYRLAAETFLDKVAVPEENVHRIPTEYDDVKAAACSYEATIREVFGLKGDELPEFDLIVLGMGPEGHTGSLLPNSYATFDTDDLACVVYVVGDSLNRITLTHPVLCAASDLAVLVSGEEKAGILEEVLRSEPDEVRFPIHVLWPVLNKVTWLVDSAAARGTRLTSIVDGVGGPHLD
ncbi:MAG: 6-phosphogluconolactonase [Phycisphaerales bacterium]|nr:MAG: 6-phosphogluconolactonase [Phycisphaerales bacterium]